MQYPTIAQPQYAFAPTMMAQGGSVAQNLASKGRNGDSMLVHMTPGEVGGLQALAMQHGGSLTINPQTGLPEANFLKNLLPTLLGVGLSFIPGVGPLAAGLTVGGIETVRTGDIGKGFLAGLGAYGGANLAGNLTAAGAQQGVQAAGAAGQDLMSQAVTNTPGLAETGAQLVPNAPTTTMADIYNTGGARDAILMRNAQAVPASVQALPASTAPTFASNAAQAGQGFQNVLSAGDTGTAARDAFLNRSGGYMGLAQDVGMAAAPSLLAPPKPYEAPVEKDEGFEYEGPYTPSQRRVSYPTDDERRRRTSEFTYFTPSNPVPFAEGGDVAPKSGDIFVSPNEARVYQDIINTQRLAGLPALDPARFVVLPGRSYARYVYNPIEGGGGVTQGTGEKDYGIGALLTKEQVETALKNQSSPSSGASSIGRRFLTSFGAAYAEGGSVPQLEDGGFVLTKKAVDGLGKGSNKKGQQVASRGLGAIPIKGAGAKRGPKAGVDDKIKTTIDGKRPALVSNGEAYVPKKQVAKKGGAKAFYALMHKAEKAAEKRKRA